MQKLLFKLLPFPPFFGFQSIRRKKFNSSTTCFPQTLQRQTFEREQISGHPGTDLNIHNQFGTVNPSHPTEHDFHTKLKILIHLVFLVDAFRLD